MPSFERLRAILFEPRNEWPRIAAERATAQSIAVGWVMVLAAIGPVAAFAGHVDLGVARATRIAIGGYATTLVVTFVLALIADALAPAFGGRKDFIASLKLVAYSFTAVYLAGIGHLAGPGGRILLFAAAIVSWSSFFIGAPILRRCENNRALAYTVVMLIAWIALAMIAGYAIAGAGAPSVPAPVRLL